MITVDDGFQIDYDSGHSDFKARFTIDEMLGNYPDALVAGKNTALRHYSYYPRSTQTMTRALWYLIGWMQCWCELVEME